MLKTCQKRVFIALSLYPLSFFANTLFNNYRNCAVWFACIAIYPVNHTVTKLIAISIQLTPILYCSFLFRKHLGEIPHSCAKMNFAEASTRNAQIYAKLVLQLQPNCAKQLFSTVITRKLQNKKTTFKQYWSAFDVFT